MNRKEPLFRVVKRESSSPVRQALAYVAAVVIALLIGAALLSSMDVDPLTFYQKMVTMGIPGNKFPWRIVENFVKLFVPLLITSLALSLAFRMRFWNIGGEGQFIMGAICAAAAAHKLGPVLPQPLVVLVMALCGILGGGLYGLIVALLKVRYNTNETLLTLMLNYIALYLLQFLGETKAGWNFFLDPDSARPKFAGFPDNADMITFPLGPFNLNLSLIIAIVLCVLLFGYLKYTKHGYEIAVVGDSPNTARYAGMKVGRIVVRTIFLSACPHRPGRRLLCLLRRHPVHLRHRRCGLDRHRGGLAGQAEHGGHRHVPPCSSQCSSSAVRLPAPPIPPSTPTSRT